MGDAEELSEWYEKVVFGDAEVERLRERAALADELAAALANQHGIAHFAQQPKSCPTCALLARHAATKESERAE